MMKKQAVNQSKISLISCSNNFYFENGMAALHLYGIIAFFAMLYVFFFYYLPTVSATDGVYLPNFEADAQVYRLLAQSFCSGSKDIFETISTPLVVLNLNWLTVAFPYLFACTIMPGYEDIFVLFFNTSLLFLTLSNYSRIMKSLNLVSYTNIFLLFLVFQPILATTLIGTNKEIISYYSFSSILSNYYEKKIFRLTIVTTIVSLFRAQTIIIVIMFFIIKTNRIRFWQILMILSIALPALTSPNLEQMYETFAATGAQETVNSAPIFQALETLAFAPPGLLLALPIRVAINLLTPLGNLSQIGSADLWVTTLAISGIEMSIFFVVSTYQVAVNFGRGKSDLWIFFVSMCTINGVVPFLQPRYYMPITPILGIFILSNVVKKRRRPLNRNISASALG